MSNTDIIIFSKQRTLQLKSLLRSIAHYSDIAEEEMTVLYTTSPEIPYDTLKSEFACRFIQDSTFLNDVRNIVEDTKNDYVFFMVDDLIYREEFSLRRIETFLDENPDIDCVTPALGRNITGLGRRARDLQQPEFSIRAGEFLVWDTAPGLGVVWNYFWGQTSYIYRKDLVLKYLLKCDPGKQTFPNPLESFYYSCMPTHHLGGPFLKRTAVRFRFLLARKTNRMACFERSKGFGQGVNLVALRGIDHTQLFEPSELHRKMEEGYIIDFRSLEKVENTWHHPGSQYFKLAKDGQ